MQAIYRYLRKTLCGAPHGETVPIIHYLDLFGISFPLFFLINRENAIINVTIIFSKHIEFLFQAENKLLFYVH